MEGFDSLAHSVGEGWGEGSSYLALEFGVKQDFPLILAFSLQGEGIIPSFAQ